MNERATPIGAVHGSALETGPLLVLLVEDHRDVRP
jgi:hypothetical protein